MITLISASSANPETLPIHTASRAVSLPSNQMIAILTHGICILHRIRHRVLADIPGFMEWAGGMDPANPVPENPMQIPEYIIVIDYRELYLYRIEAGPVALIVEHVDLEHDCQTNVSIVEWNDLGDACNRIAVWINHTLDRYHPGAWGLACPRAIQDKCVAALSSEHAGNLVMHVDSTYGKIDLSNLVAKLEDHVRLADSLHPAGLG